MKNCVYCQKEIEETATYCQYCGAKQPETNQVVDTTPIINEQPNFDQQTNNYNQTNPQYKYDYVPNSQPQKDSNPFWWGVLGFFIPLAGLILFIIFRQDNPKAAKGSGIGALIGVGVGIICFILFIILMFAIGGSMMDYQNNMMPGFYY